MKRDPLTLDRRPPSGIAPTKPEKTMRAVALKNDGRALGPAVEYCWLLSKLEA